MLTILLLLDGLEELLVYFVLLLAKHVCELKTLTRGGVRRGLGMVIARAEGVLLRAAARSAVATVAISTVPWLVVGLFFFQLFIHYLYLLDGFRRVCSHALTCTHVDRQVSN